MRKHTNFRPSFSFLLFFSLSPLFSPFFPLFFLPPPLKWPYGRQLERRILTTRLPGRDGDSSFEERKTAPEVFERLQRQISTSLDHAVRQHSEKHTILVGLDPTTFKMAYSIAH